MIDMDEDSRQLLFQQFTTIKIFCTRHSQEIANMFIIDEESEYKGFICATCYSDMVQSGIKIDGIVMPAKFIISQIHQTCTKFMTELSVSSFVDYYLTNTLHLARQFATIKQSVLQISILNFFKKYRSYLNGTYFEQYYRIIKEITVSHHSKNYNKDQAIKSSSKKLVEFIIAFNRLIIDCEEYSSLAFQEKLNGKFLVKQIKMEIEQVYKEIKDKISKLKKNQNNEEEILHLLNPNESSDFSRFYKFSSTLSHPNITILQPRKIKMPNNTDNEYTVLSLIEPSIGSKKKSITFKMDGIKGWVSIGIAIRKKVEDNQFKFESTSSHGTFQISYDGYGWSDDSSSNEQYTSWYYNQGDTVNLTVNPSTSQLTFVKNNVESSPYVLKFKSEKKDKLYFCVAVNYNEDSVSIIE